MALARFCVSLDEELLQRFDTKIRKEHYPTRSKAVADLIRASLVEKEWLADEEVAGAIVLVYDHHKHDLLSQLVDTQHDHQTLIISTQHIHLDHNNCLEIIAIRGQAHRIGIFLKHLKAIKGLKHISLAAGTTGKGLQ